MDRLFLDANILFSAAWSGRSGLLRLWELPDVQLITSDYALIEALRNLSREDQHDRLDNLIQAVEICSELADTGALPDDVALPEKDWPVLLAAIESGSTHLLTGDQQHFGRYFGKTIKGVLILRPAAYLAQHDD